jgi:hypothetical protein
MHASEEWSMALERAQPHSRRLLLTAAIGGAASVIATAFGRPLAAHAADGEAVLIGQLNEGTAATTIGRTTKGPALRVQNTSDEIEGGPALEATSYWGDAVRAEVGGIGQTAIRTISHDGTALNALSENGLAVDAAGTWAIRAIGGVKGVHAEASGFEGTAVRAIANQDGHALLTTGRIQFGQASGVAVIAAGSRQVTITPAVKVSTSTKVITTLQSSAGGVTVVHRISRNIAANSFTIYLTATATHRCYVAWLLIG